jgi:uncharacterized protein YeaO (DUF488 family)
MSPLQFRTVQLGSPRQPGEGLRVGTVRFLPRGVRKSDYAKRDFFDVWLPILAPSRELLRSVRAGELRRGAFAQRYRTEMDATEPRQVIQLLVEMARQTPISVGCYCADEWRCHRRVLGELIRFAAGEPAIRPLAEDCVYTIVHPDKLEYIGNEQDGADWLTEQRRWATAVGLWHAAQQNSERLPIVFGDATNCSRLTHWAQLDSIQVHDDHTDYGISNLLPIRGRHSPQELTLCSTGEAIAPGFIRPYALVRTRSVSAIPLK